MIYVVHNYRTIYMGFWGFGVLGFWGPAVSGDTAVIPPWLSTAVTVTVGKIEQVMPDMGFIVRVSPTEVSAAGSKVGRRLRHGRERGDGAVGLFSANDRRGGDCAGWPRGVGPAILDRDIRSAARQKLTAGCAVALALAGLKRASSVKYSVGFPL